MSRVTHLAAGVLVFGVLASGEPVHAYEVVTHAAITQVAFSRLREEIPDILTRLGIRERNDAFGDSYFDIFGGNGVLRRANVFENRRIAGSGVGLSPFSIAGWLMRGAIREDDDPDADDPSPKGDDPQGDIHRVFRHFFDPKATGEGALTNPFAEPCQFLRDPPAPCQSALNWALGTVDAKSDPNRRRGDRRNHFTTFDAREALWRALTLLKDDGDGAIVPFADNDSALYRYVQRQEYWATTFRALGDVLHLNQDMAQPQHTRNDPHSGKYSSTVQTQVTGHKSTYEQFVEAGVLGLEILRVGTDTPPSGIHIKQASLNFDGYATPRFNRYTDFWTTLDGKGLADFSNAGFFSAGTNIGDKRNPYASPRQDMSAYPKTLVQPEQWDGKPLAASGFAKILQLMGTVEDKNSGQIIDNVPMTGYGIWDQFMQERGLFHHYTLYRENYVAQANLLLPRAVAYSAGILEYFFRGKMEISLPDTGFYGIVDHSRFAPPNPPTDVDNGFKGFDKVKLKLKNSTDPITPSGGQPLPQDMSDGLLVAVLKFHRINSNCYDDLLRNWPTTSTIAYGCRSPTEEIVVSDPVLVSNSQPVPVATAASPNGAEYVFNFSRRQLPINAWDVVLQVVYRGKLGAEADAVVVATKNISEPTFATFANIIDRIWLNGQLYTPEAIAQNQSLFASMVPGCRSGTTGNYVVHPDCYNHSDFHHFVPGTSTVEIAANNTTPTPIAPRRFARLAFLSDVDTPITLSLVTTSCWVSENEFLFTIPPYEAQLEANNFWTYGPPRVFRGTKTWSLFYCVNDLGIVPTPWTDSMLDRYDALTVNEMVPTPLLITGW